LNKAIFFDRDGVINDLVYHIEQEIIDSPFTVAQFRLIEGVSEAINHAHRSGYLAVLVSNQPGIARGHFTLEVFESICRKMNDELALKEAFFNGEYYCLHHPEALIEEYRITCGCRKPLPGLIIKAASELEIDLTRSWMIGDNLSDIRAGQSAGCKTVLLGKIKCEYCRLMDEQNSHPDLISQSLLQTVRDICKGQEPH